jgi:hypothetical protein
MRGLLNFRRFFVQVTPFSRMTKDIVTEIVDDHKIIKNLARRYESESETNTDERQKIANTIIRESMILN